MTEKTKNWEDDVDYFLVFPKPEFRRRLLNLWEKFSKINFRNGDLGRKQMFARALGCGSFTEIYQIFYFVDNIHQSTFVKIWQNMRGLERVIDALLRVMKKEFVLQWLTTPNEALQYREPREFLANQEGINELLGLIQTIESGLPT